MSNHRITDNLDSLFEVLPPEISQAINEKGKNSDLIEIILDLGRIPTARFTNEEVELSDTEVTEKKIKFVVDRIGKFDGDNRAGLARTLHRIAAIRNSREVQSRRRLRKPRERKFFL